MRKTLLILALISAVATTAQARRGADDPAGHDANDDRVTGVHAGDDKGRRHGGHGADDTQPDDRGGKTKRDRRAKDDRGSDDASGGYYSGGKSGDDKGGKGRGRGRGRGKDD